MVEVPTKAEFDALATRVEALEAHVAAILEDYETFKTLLKTLYDLVFPAEA